MRHFIIALALVLIASFCHAETWELAIQPYDKEDLASGHKRAKAGDVVAVKPYPWSWGRAELANYLIVIVDNMTEEEAMEIMSPLYEDDTPPTIENASVITAKRKFKLDIDKLKANILPDLDKTKLDKKASGDTYQPFKDGNVRVLIDTLEADLMQNKYDTKWRKGKKK
jgi:hypothetical protein